MDETEIKNVLEAALLAAGRPLTLDRLSDLFAAKGSPPERATLKRALDALANDYQGRGIEVKEVASGYRIQVKRATSDWLAPLWEERAPRYTRALLETLALIAYRQPITRAEIEEVRGVVVSTNIIRTLLERGWVRVVGHRDVPGKPAMFGTTREFLDYFGLKKLEDLPPLAELKDGLPELSPQADIIESLEAAVAQVDAGVSEHEEAATEPQADDNVVKLRPDGGAKQAQASDTVESEMDIEADTDDADADADAAAEVDADAAAEVDPVAAAEGDGDAEAQAEGEVAVDVERDTGADTSTAAATDADINAAASTDADAEQAPQAGATADSQVEADESDAGEVSLDETPPTDQDQESGADQASADAAAELTHESVEGESDAADAEASEPEAPDEHEHTAEIIPLRARHSDDQSE